MNLSLILFTIGILGFVLNRKNIILMLISIEIMLLAITFLILVSSLSFDDILGQTYAIYIIAIAGAESAIGLGILVAFYRFVFFKSNHLSFNPRNYSIKPVSIIPLGTRNYSTNTHSKPSLDPWFITGIFDAESSFVVTILKNPRYKTGWNIQARTQIKMHERDRELILKIQEYFGGIGYVSNPNKNSTVEFRVSTVEHITNVIIPHFSNYPLLTKKYFDYAFFKQVVKLMSEKEHSNLQGIQTIVNHRASMNGGLSNDLQKAFPDTVPVKKEDIVINYNILVSAKEWMAGFSTATEVRESNFFITVQKSKTKSGIATSLRFSIAQDSRDVSLLENFVGFFGCGYVAKYKNRLVCEFIVTRIDDIINKIIPFFEEHKIIGSKYSNFLDFKRAALIIKNKDHLKQDGIGLNQILLLKKIITDMNKGKNNHGQD
jgi:NADH:ubiquinone oxidoreductase subunit K